MAAEQITARQLNAMLFLFLAGGFEVFLPRYAAADAGGEALLCVGLATTLGLLGAAGVVQLARCIRGSDLALYGAAVLGPPLARVAGAWYVLVLVVVAAQSLAAVGLVGDVVLGWPAAATPPLLFLLAVACGLVAGRGLSRAARLAEYAAPVVFLLVLLVGLTALGRVDWANYGFRGDWGALARGTVHLLGRFAPAYILLLVLSSSARAPLSGGAVPAFLAAGLVMAVAVLPVGLYGGGAAAATFMPSLSLLADSIFGVAPGLFFPGIGLWLLGSLFQVILGFLLSTILLQPTAGERGCGFPLPAGAGIVWCGLLLWSNYGGSYAFGAGYFPYLVFPAAVGLPPLLFLLPAWRRLMEGRRVPAVVADLLAVAAVRGAVWREKWRHPWRRRKELQ